MLTSKEIIERTGISRATLNNYIASGLVARPQVLPPGPEHGAAPRIGYFPDDTIERVETIQRLKREGWSISRIAGHFAAPSGEAAAGAAAVAGPASAELARQLPAAPSAPAAPPASAPAPAPAAPEPALRLTRAVLAHPAYLVDDGLRLVWMNDEARQGGLSPLAGRAPVAGDPVLPHLLAAPDEATRDAMLRLHLQAARQRGLDITDLARGLPQQALRFEGVVGEREAVRPEPGLVLQTRVPGTPARSLCAVQFREGILFACLPAAVAAEEALAPAAAGRPAAPRLTPVAVLVSTLQDASGLWVRLTAQEYFELLNEVGAELERIFRLHRGQPGRQGGEVLVCYFLPGAHGSHLWNALAAAQQTRDAMRQVSRRWQVRKGWDVELCMNIGIDEAQDWIGGIGGGDAALRVLGDAPERAEQLSRASRLGAILVTRNLLGKLAEHERAHLTYGVPRPEGAPAEGPLLFTFTRLQDIASPLVVPARFADLAVAELLDLSLPAGNPAPQSAGR